MGFWSELGNLVGESMMITQWVECLNDHNETFLRMKIENDVRNMSRDKLVDIKKQISLGSVNITDPERRKRYTVVYETYRQVTRT